MQDDYIFSLLLQQIRFITPSGNKKYYGAKTYHSTRYRKMKNTFRPILSCFALDKNPSFEDYIPYSSLITSDIVVTEDWQFVTTFKLDGVPFEIENLIDIESHQKNLNAIFKTFASEPIGFYFHNARHDIEASLAGKFDSKFAQEVNDKYYEGFKKGSLRGNSLYITLIYNPFFNKVDKSSFLKMKNKTNELKIYIKTMSDYNDRFESNLKAFNPSRLCTYFEGDKKYSKQLEFYSFLIGGRWEKVRALNAPIKNYLMGGVKNLQFKGDLMQINYNDDKKMFGRILEIKDYTSETFAGILDVLMYLEVNYTITQAFNPVGKTESKKILNKQKDQFISSADDSITQFEQFDIALDEITNGDICFGNYSFSILIYGETIPLVKKNTNIIIAGLTDIGLGISVADIAQPSTYFSQFPTNYTERNRVVPITSKNFAGLIGLHNFPKGKEKGNCWGEAITIFKTPNKQPYFMNFHQNTNGNDFGDFLLGNVLGIGQSGGGKTVLMNFICNQLLKYNDKSSFPANIPDSKKQITVIYLDKDKGAMGNILATGGRYVSLENGSPTGFNPFMCENTPSNKRHLQNLIKILVTRNNENLSSSEERKIGDAIDYLMDNFEREERKFGISLLLENITQNHEDENSIKNRLQLWKNGSKFGWVFDNENDLLDFPDEVNFFGIDGTNFLDDAEVSGAMTYYILWRVLDLVDGRRFVLTIDEFWKWLENPLVQTEVRNKEKTIRKENGLFALFSQSVEDVLELEICKTIVEQSATTIYFTNDKGNEEDYVKGLNCTKEEFEIIRNLNPSDYKCLVKKNNESVIVNLDLSSIGNEDLKILSTGLPYVPRVEQIFKNEENTLDEKVEELRLMYKGKNK